MKKIRNLMLPSLALLLTLALTTAAIAGFGDKLKGVTGASESAGASIGDVQAEQSALVTSFTISQTSLMEAQVLIADALGLKDSRDSLQAASDALGKGNTEPSKDDLKKSIQITNEANENISRIMKEGATLDTAAKKKLALSLIPYGVSLGAGAVMISQATALAKGIEAQVKAASVTSVMKVKRTFDAGLYLSPKIPVHFQGQAKQLQSLIAFAKNNKVSIPSEALKAAAIDF